LIYLDSSVLLAHLLGESRRPPASIWATPLVSSRLLQYEVVVRLHALRSKPAKLARASTIFQQITFAELNDATLARTLKPFPLSVRSLDAIHLSSMDFMRSNGLPLDVATYDKRLADAAKAIGFSLLPL
jgi:predicted nucleic acid-binding protein